MHKKEILLLFSGGRDSFLSACKLIDEDYFVYLVHYDNGCGVGNDNVEDTAKRIIERYGEARVKYIGTKSIVGFWRSFFQPIFTMKPSEIIKNYGELTMSQFHCLTCRTSMYILSVLLCKNMGIKFIAEGGRRDQGFIIELEAMISRYTTLLKENEIELMLPVYNLSDDWERKNELLIRGFLPKTYETQCYLGVPLSDSEKDNDVIDAVLRFYDEFMLDRIREMIKKSELVGFDHGTKIY